MKLKLLALLLFPFTLHASNYNNAFDTLMKYEGNVYHNNPKDPGGPTKYGWTLRSYKATVNKNATINTIKNLTVDDAKQLYKKYWWNKYGASKINDKELSSMLFLAQVNMGPRKPNSVLQDTVNDLCDYDMPLDGILGNTSIKLINSCDRAEEGFPYYLHNIFIDDNHAQQVWKWAKKGLRNRIFHYRDLNEVQK